MSRAPAPVRTITFEYPALILHGDLSKVEPNFDAELDPDVCDARTNADLTVILRVCLQRSDPVGGRGTMRDTDNHAVPVRSWKDHEWDAWKARYQREITAFWSGKFWLRTPDKFKGLDRVDGRIKHRCNVYCKLDIETTTSTLGAHAIIPVVRIDGNRPFRSNSTLYSNRDLFPMQFSVAHTKFFTHVHEVGHLLGLNHPGYDPASGHPASAQGCVNGGEAVCYSADADSVMGMGHVRRLAHAFPWRKAMSLITETKIDDWTADMTHIYPRVVV